MKKALPLIILLSGLLAVCLYLIFGRGGSSKTRVRETRVQEARIPESRIQNGAVAGEASKMSSFGADIDAYYRLLRLPFLAVGVARGDSLLFFKGAGSINSAGNNPPTADHVFPIGSLTNAFIAVALKQMEGEGKLSLQDPVSSFPNEYFTENRQDRQTTLANIISHTSESEPQGTQFVYNVHRFNVVFNTFKTLPRKIQNRILTPLQMDNTLLRFTEKEHGHLNPDSLRSGTDFVMMSSVNDLVSYSASLGRNKLLTARQYEELTTPFYPGSPYGQGWFTTRFEGTDIHWVYGCGDNDATLLLRAPSSELTLVIHAPSMFPLAAKRLGYGNPFNSMLVCSFFRNFVQETSVNSRLPVEEKFAKAVADTARTSQLLQSLMSEFPTDTIWQTPTAFELMAASNNRAIRRFGLKMADNYVRQNHVHPVKAWYAGLIFEQNGKRDEAMASFEALGWGDQYREQPYKFNAMMKLVKRYKFLAPRHAKEILQDLIRYKEHIGVNDRQYKEARQMLED